jgi:hypothetical protein
MVLLQVQTDTSSTSIIGTIQSATTTTTTNVGMSDVRRCCHRHFFILQFSQVARSKGNQEERMVLMWW